MRLNQVCGLTVMRMVEEMPQFYPRRGYSGVSSSFYNLACNQVVGIDE